MKPAKDDYDWLELEPVRKRNRKKRENGEVKSAVKLARERDRAKSMAKSPFGKNRIWACDGEFVWFRPKRNGVVVANPSSIERHQQFLASGHYEHVETQDDVEVYRLTELSPFKRHGLNVGELNDNDVFLLAAKAACKRDWKMYVDALEELSGRFKGRYQPAFATVMYNEMLQRLELQILNSGGPGSAECAAGLSGVQIKRGRGKGRVILTARI